MNLNSNLHLASSEGSWGFLGVPGGSRGPQTWKFRDFEFHCVPGVRINHEIKEVAVYLKNMQNPKFS